MGLHFDKSFSKILCHISEINRWCHHSIFLSLKSVGTMPMGLSLQQNSYK